MSKNNEMNSVYKSLAEWRKEEPNAYQAAYRKGMIEEICEKFGWKYKKRKKKEPKKIIHRLNQLEVDELDGMCDFWKNYMSEIYGVKLEYNIEFVAQMDNYIQEIRLEPNAKSYEGTRMMISYSLGRCMISEYGGSWIKEDENPRTAPCVLISDILTVFPFNKVNKQFDNGSEDSILGLFRSIRIVLETNGFEGIR